MVMGRKTNPLPGTRFLLFLLENPINARTLSVENAFRKDCIDMDIQNPNPWFWPSKRLIYVEISLVS